MRLLEGPAWVFVGVIISAWAYGTGLGTFQEPGVGFVAFTAGLFIMAVGAIITVLRRPDRQKQGVASGQIGRAPFLGSPAFKLTYTLGLLLFYALFLNVLGYLITTFVVLFGLFYDPVRQRWTSPLFASVVSVAATYFVFEVWLRSQLPRGILPWW